MRPRCHPGWGVYVLLLLTGCATSPERNVPVVPICIDEKGQPSFARRSYRGEVIVRVPPGTRLIGVEGGGQALLAAMRRRFYERFLSSGTAVELWVWLQSERVLASFDGRDFEYDLSNEEDRIAVLARAYDPGDER